MNTRHPIRATLLVPGFTSVERLKVKATMPDQSVENGFFNESARLSALPRLVLARFTMESENAGLAR